MQAVKTHEADDGKPLRCIYCRNPLTPTTRVAHVWPYAMGGRLASRRICCDRCNNAFAPIEDAMCRALATPAALLDGRRGDGTPIEVRAKMEGLDVKLGRGFADVQVPGVSFDRVTRKVTIPLPAGGIGRWAVVVAKALQSQGLGPENLDRFDLEPAAPPPLPHGPRRDEFDLLLNFPGRRPFFLKVALELIAHHRHDLALRPELSVARRAARYGEVDGSSFTTDGDSNGSGLLPDVEPDEPYHAAEVWSCGRFVSFRIAFLLRRLATTGVLATDWGGEPFRVAYAFPIREPARFLAHEFRPGDGPRMALWTPAAKSRTEQSAASEIEEMSWRVGQTIPRPSRDAQPNLEELRAAVREELVRLASRRRKKGTSTRRADDLPSMTTDSNGNYPDAERLRLEPSPSTGS